MVAEVIDNTTSRGRTLRFLFDGEYDEFKKELYARWAKPRFLVLLTGKWNLRMLIITRLFLPSMKVRWLPRLRVCILVAKLMKRMEIKGIDFAYITLHVGLGNFREVDVEDLTKHKMDSEQIFVTPETVKIVNDAKDEKHKICAVGTTVVRTLESCVTTKGRLTEFEGWTNKFIFPRMISACRMLSFPISICLIRRY